MIHSSTTQDYPIGEFTSVFTGNEAFLADHIIQDKKILPGMAYLEISRAAVAASIKLKEQQIIVLTDSVFIQPLIVEDKCSVTVKIYPGSKGEFGIEVMTDAGIHFQSKASIQDKQETATHLDLPALEKQCLTAGPTKQQIYAEYKKLGINYGFSHQGIEEIKIGQDCALARLSLSASSNRGMDLNPGMLDSIIQSALVFDADKGSTQVPFAVKSTKIYGTLPDKTYAYLVKTHQGIDYTISDDKGEIKVTLEGFVSRELDLSPKTDSLVYFQPEWQEEKIIKQDHSNKAESKTLDNHHITIIKEKTSYEALVKTVFKTAKKLIQDKIQHHTLEVQLPEDKPAWKGIIAALKTIKLEYSKINYRLKIGDRYLMLNYNPRDMENISSYAWSDNKTILITGGLGGIGLILAQDISQSSKGCNLILVGRRAADDDKKGTMKRLEAFGTKIVYEKCDITKREEVTALMNRYPNINVIIHGAGLIQDNFINKKTLEEIEQVLAPKVKGLENLDEASRKLKLDYFITMSSVAGSLGNPGQLDYAAGNGYMDAYMDNRAVQVSQKKRYGKSMSINWPLWESAGMQISEEDIKNMQQVYKIKPLPTESGLTALKQSISSDNHQVLVLFGNKKNIQTVLDTVPKLKKKIKKTVNIESSKLTREILQEVKSQTSQHLKIPVEQLDEESNWDEFGFDSILLSSFINKVNSQFNLSLMPTALFEATNIQLFSKYLAENYSEQVVEKLNLTSAEQTNITSEEETNSTVPEADQHKISSFAQGFEKSYKALVSYRKEDIAIIGMSCRIAGAQNTAELWKNLMEEKDMITEIPLDRWDWQAYPDSRKWGSFIDDVDKFDPLFFGISPAEAMYMSPEQRLMMQYVWECLENAGCGGDSTRGTNTGIFIGCGSSSYTTLLQSMPIQAYSSTGMVPSIGPNRISYLMDWHGPSQPIETACSSSLVALHRAVEAIHLGHCNQAIAGGVSLLLDPASYVSFTKAGMLCEDGRCKTFSDKANGYVRGEGIGMLMLKPLKAAIQDGNIIHAIVKGTAENHGGRTNSLTAPNPKSQAAVIRNAVKNADVDFSRISYIECHGTGTELGDPVEIEGIKMAYNQLVDGKESKQTCKLGSIKSNIGHLELAAGVIGVIKVVLQMKHKKIAKSLHCDKINPYINLSNTSFRVAQTASDWQVKTEQTRLAGVSSFGFGGVNAHVILEEFKGINLNQEEDNEDISKPQSQLLILSARTEEILLNYVTQYQDFIKTLDKNDGPRTLKRISYTLQLGRSEMQERLVFIAKSIEEWGEQLEDFLKDRGKTRNRAIYRGTVKASSVDNLEIGDTQAGRDYIKQLIDGREFGKLSELWVKGSKIDWHSLY
jgi:polyketide synthase PksN